MASSFDNIKDLQFVITLGIGTFGSSNANQITLQGFRASVDIDNAGGQTTSTLRAQIYGVTQSDINSITTLQFQERSFIPSTIVVTAIDGPQKTQVFAGNIVNAWGDYGQMPDAFLKIQAQAGYVNQLTPIPPTSFRGGINVATLIGQLATKMGYTFENNGVNVTLSNPYVANTGIEQVKDLAQQAGIVWGLDGMTLFICPPNTPRMGSMIPNIGPNSGLKGYPTFDGVGVNGVGVNFETFFNPALKFMGAFQLTTSIPRAAGMWIATSISHTLESQKPDGLWFSRVRGNSLGLVSGS
jgi:hypothetical protein